MSEPSDSNSTNKSASQPPQKKPEPVPQEYEIAQPVSYDVFPLDPQKEAASKGDKLEEGVHAERFWAGKSEKFAQEEWSDANKEAPTVDPKDRDNFTTPLRRGGVAKALAGIPREKRAVWIVHGMGQQIPFETVDSLTQGLLRVLKECNPPQTPTPRLRTVKIGGEVLQRVELDIDGAGNHYDLHLYESYWAPKTEGVAKLKDVVSFLWDGGTRGLLNWVKHFQRAMFGGMARFQVPWRTPVWLCGALLILAALTVINGVILTVAAAKSGLPFPNSGPLTTHWSQLTALASCMIAVAFSFGAVLFIADLSKPQEMGKGARLLLSTATWLSLIFTVIAILKTALLMLVITHLDWTKSYDGVAGTSAQGKLGTIGKCVEEFFTGMPSQQLQGFATVVILIAVVLVALAMILRAMLRSSETPAPGYPVLVFLGLLSFALNVISVAGAVWIWQGHGTRGVLPVHVSFLYSRLWVWPFLILFSAKVRSVMVQYVGDVAIYVTPNKLDRFDEVRIKIKEAARTVASAIFTAYETGTKKFLYEKIAVVGHSLGSVIAYDTVNRLMLDDWLSGSSLRIAQRTETMVTFGSPLNKTAFLFTIQGKDSMHIRERLACTVQPLIMSYPKFRKLHWINVYSKNDIISGPLEFYDLPGFTNPPHSIAVKNIIDEDAAVPLVAHVSYWKNKLVWEELRQQIVP